MLTILSENEPILIGLPKNKANELYLAITKALLKSTNYSSLHEDPETTDALLVLLGGFELRQEQLQLGNSSPS